MSIIQLKGAEAIRFQNFLKLYREKYNKDPGPVERTEAFFCARSVNQPCLPFWYN
jgi:hypothetical protein